MIDHGVQDYGREHWDAGAIRCSCGQALEMTGDWDALRVRQRVQHGRGQPLRANWRVFCRETGEVIDDDVLS